MSEVQENVLRTGGWTKEEADKLVGIYDPENSDATVAEAMKELNRSKRSIQGKLVSEKLYVAPEKPAPKKKDEGPTKGEILTALVENGFPVEGLDAATKPALTNVLDYVVANKPSE